MTKVCIVTGFTPIPDHPRKEEEYNILARHFTEIAHVPRLVYRTALQNCWLRQWLDRNNLSGVFVSRGDNPAKNTLAYHIVQHQKTEWLKWATQDDAYSDTFVWLDFGIFHQPGVTAAVISEFLKRVRLNDFAIPGCWPVGHSGEPNWRFCGSTAVVPRDKVSIFDSMTRMVTKDRAREQNRVSWEINDWADAEVEHGLPVRWYSADHNEKQFTNYV